LSLDIEFTDRANKQLANLRAADRIRILDRLRAYGEEPERRRHDVRPLIGTEGLWRLRMGDWRVIFERAETSVLVLRVLHRREAYR
jgi:mRNA interferase RelE/StbE